MDAAQYIQIHSLQQSRFAKIYIPSVLSSARAKNHLHSPVDDGRTTVNISNHSLKADEAHYSQTPRDNNDNDKSTKTKTNILQYEENPKERL